MQEKYYRWYPKRKNGEPNLNPWWAVAYRRLNQWCRRYVYWKLRPSRYDELIREQAVTAAPDVLSPEARTRLGELLWILGYDTPYRHTREQSERIGRASREMVKEVLAEMKEEEEKEVDASTQKHQRRRIRYKDSE